MFQEKMMRQDDDTLFDSFITRVIWANWAPRGHIQVSSISPVRNVSLRYLLPPCHQSLSSTLSPSSHNETSGSFSIQERYLMAEVIFSMIHCSVLSQ